MPSDGTRPNQRMKLCRAGAVTPVGRSLPCLWPPHVSLYAAGRLQLQAASVTLRRGLTCA